MMRSAARPPSAAALLPGRHRPSGARSLASSWGKREEHAQEYLNSRDWTVARALASRRAVREGTGFAKELDVHWVQEHMTVFEAVKAMSDAKIGSVLVTSTLAIPSSSSSSTTTTTTTTMTTTTKASSSVSSSLSPSAHPLPERKKLLGILTERDYLSKIVVNDLSSKSTSVGSIMTPRRALHVIQPEYSLYECLDIFEKGRFRHLPVVLPRPDLGTGEEDVLAVLSMRDLVYEFKRFHFASLEYLEDFIDFPIW